MIDKAGREIKAGDYVVYSTRSGDTPVLKWGFVIKVLRGTGPIMVQGIDEWCFRQTRQQKLSRLTTSERIIVIPDDIVPEYIRQLLLS